MKSVIEQIAEQTGTQPGDWTRLAHIYEHPMDTYFFKHSDGRLAKLVSHADLSMVKVHWITQDDLPMWFRIEPPITPQPPQPQPDYISQPPL